MPSTLEAWSNIEVEAEISEDWYDQDFRKFCDLLLVSSYFVDNKIMKGLKVRPCSTNLLD